MSKPDARATLFLSDLHLSPDEPETIGRFRRWAQEVGADARAVYILGDLFEAWPGDDNLAMATPVVSALRGLTDSGTELYLLHGNRDFLLGPDFCRATGGRLLPDPSVIDLYGVPTLILHGDSLCTDDHVYQQFRRQVRDPAWQQAVLAKPLAERLAMARQMRMESETAKGGKSGEIMDANPDAVMSAFRAHGCRRMIHGHTHRPAVHESEVDDIACQRWVLPDWYDGKGGYLRCDASGCVAQAY